MCVEFDARRFERKGQFVEKSMPIECFSQTKIPLEWGEFDARVYRDPSDQTEVLVVSQGHLQAPSVFVRIHSECLTGEAFASLKCDCRFQLNEALRMIAETGAGVVIYLRQEGRGIGLGHKIQAYELQRKGHDTVTANLALGFPEDSREFDFACEIIKSLGIQSIRINTNNPDKIKAVEKHGIRIAERIPSIAEPQKYNVDYLKTKKDKLGHQLEVL